MTHAKSMKTINKLVASLMVAAMFAAAFMMSGHNAKAADGTATLTGGLSLSTISNFTFTGNTTLDGTARTLTSSFTVVATDTSGSVEGWDINASLDLTDDAITKTLTGARVTGATFTPSVGDPANTILSYTTPRLLTDAGDTIATSDNTTGDGQQTSILFNLGLVIPNTAVAGTYVGTLTIEIVAQV